MSLQPKTKPKKAFYNVPTKGNRFSILRPTRIKDAISLEYFSMTRPGKKGFVKGKKSFIAPKLPHPELSILHPNNVSYGKHTNPAITHNPKLQSPPRKKGHGKAKK